MLNKKNICHLIAWLPLLCAMSLSAQIADPMPNFRNPEVFFSSGTNALTFRGWSARVGERCYTYGNVNDTTDGYTIKSTCSDPNSPAIVGHSNIISSMYYSGTDNYTCANTSGIWDHNDHRFQIITQMNDGLVGYTVNPATPTVGMPRIPPGYTSSIRLGDLFTTGQAQNGNCNYSSTSPNRGSEALFYTLHVTPQNALVFINYAVVARKFDHTAYDAGEFCLRVVAQNDNGTWATVPINDSLWYKVSAPHYTGALPAPWLDGLPGPNMSGYTCGFVYKPWAKVAISLNAFLYKNVRIEMYTSDCNWDVDPLMAYICGDYQAMALTPNGCPDPESLVVDTIEAPAGLLSYAWYVSTHGAVPDEKLLVASYMDTVEFRQVWPVGGGTDTSNLYVARFEDFILSAGAHAGDTVDKQTFKCVMTSALNPDKPFESRVYNNFINRKPIIGYGYEAHCDTTITFTDGSIVLVAEGLEEDSTHWIFYADTLGLEPMDTAYGSVVTHSFPAPGKYSVRLYVSTGGSPCTSAELFVCEAIGQPEVDFTMSSSELCESDVLELHASDAVHQLEDATLQWAIDDSVLAITSADPRFMVPLGDHYIHLTVTNKAGCSSSTYDSVRVFGQPSIDLSSTVAAICLGDSVTLSAVGSISYSWNSVPYDPSLDSVQGQTSFTVAPSVNTTYFLLPSEDNPCSVEGAQVNIEVIPYPVPTIRTGTPHVDKENGSVTCRDVSPYAASSFWTFSDGLTSEGSNVIHSFADLSADSVGITLHTCNRLDCCADTTIHLPIKVTTVWFPNTFTPDRTGNNRFGMITSLTITDYEIYIYNRQGQLVHSSTDPADQWDGTIDGGGAAPQGTYVWFCRYAYSANANYTRNGTVTLIR